MAAPWQRCPGTASHRHAHMTLRMGHTDCGLLAAAIPRSRAALALSLSQFYELPQLGELVHPGRLFKHTVRLDAVSSERGCVLNQAVAYILDLWEGQVRQRM